MSRLKQLKKDLKTKTMFELFGDASWMQRDQESYEHWVKRINIGSLRGHGLKFMKTHDDSGDYDVVDLKSKTVLESLDGCRIGFLMSQADERYS
jgi:hypothetical protein